MDEAQAEVALARRAFEDVDQSPWSTRSGLVPYLDLVKGELQLRTGETAAGRALLLDVARRLRALPGPDAWMQALFVLEGLARVAREAADWELAEALAQQMLEHDRAYAGSHYALGLVAAHKGDTARERQAFAEAERLWPAADADLRELRLAQKRAADR